MTKAWKDDNMLLKEASSSFKYSLQNKFLVSNDDNYEGEKILCGMKISKDHSKYIYYVEDKDSPKYNKWNDKSSNFKKVDSKTFYDLRDKAIKQAIKYYHDKLVNAYVNSDSDKAEYILKGLDNTNNDNFWYEVYEEITRSMKDIKKEADNLRKEDGWGVWVSLDPKYHDKESYWFKKNISRGEANFYASQGNMTAGYQFKGCSFKACKMDEHPED